MNITTRPIVRMRMLTDSEDVTGGEITLDDNVKMSLTLEDQYKGRFLAVLVSVLFYFIPSHFRYHTITSEDLPTILQGHA